MHVYLGNKMMDLPEFNFPWFFQAEEKLRAIDEVTEVFNPARHDLKFGFDAFGTDGSEEAMILQEFSRRMALTTDWNWIGQHSDLMVVGPDWKNSTGTISEIACHQALGLPVYEFESFVRLAHDFDMNFAMDNGFPAWKLAPILSLGVE
jgi:hypothetical protein